MKKRIIKLAIAGAIAIVGTVGYNFSVNQNDANFQFTMDNVEALARGEGGGSISCCAGFWGECTLADGSKSKAPLIQCEF